MKGEHMKRPRRLDDLPRKRIEVDDVGGIPFVRGVVEAGGAFWVRGAGPSMSPTIRDGDSVLLEPVRRPLRAGDVVLVDVKGRGVLHRVRRVRGSRIWTQGDGTLAGDPPIGSDRVIARATILERDGRRTALAWRPGLEVGSAVRGARARLRLGLARAARRLRGSEP